MRLFLPIVASLFVFLRIANADELSSLQDKAAIDHELSAGRKAHVVVDLVGDDLRSDDSDDALVKKATKARKEFFAGNRYLIGKITGELPLTPTFAAQITTEEYRQLIRAPGVRRISYNGTLSTRQENQLADTDVRTDATGLLGRNLQIIGVDNALGQQGIGGQQQIVAFIDTGIDSNHKSLAGRVIGGKCFSTNSDLLESLCPGGVSEATGIASAVPCEVLPYCNHGTATASLATGYAVTPTLSGPYDDVTVDYYGVAPLAFTYPIMAMSQPKDGGEPVATRFDVRRALQHVYQRRNDFGAYRFAAINLSLNANEADQDAACDDDPMAVDIGRLRNADIATVISAGNNGDHAKVAWPACISNAVVVASSDLNDQISSFSNFSPLVDFFAPGQGVSYALPGDKTGNTLSGTSFAAPHVAGAIASVRSISSALGLEAVEGYLRRNGQSIRVGSVLRPRIETDQAAAAARPGWIHPAHESITFHNGTPPLFELYWKVFRGSAVWNVEEKPDWISVSGFTGKAPENPSIVLSLNDESLNLPSGTRGLLRVSNKTVVQPDISVWITYEHLAPSPTVPFHLVHLGFNGGESPENPHIAQAEVVLGPGENVNVVRLGFPPNIPPSAWASRALRGSSELSWEVKSLPPWLSVEPASGTLRPGPDGSRFSLSLRPQGASNLAPGRSYVAKFYIQEVNHYERRIDMEAELYVNSPPSHFLQANLGRGPVFMGQVGGPFATLQPSLGITKQGGIVQWKITNVPAWLNLSAIDGTADASIDLSINEYGERLPAGVYSTYLVIRNLSGYQKPITKIVTLIVRRR